MWDNEGWASQHIRKHCVTVDEAWQVVFESSKCIPLESPYQLHYPPFKRYWTIGATQTNRLLMVVWEQHRETKNLITAFEPSKEQVKIYESKTKKIR